MFRKAENMVCTVNMTDELWGLLKEAAEAMEVEVDQIVAKALVYDLDPTGTTEDFKELPDILK